MRGVTSTRRGRRAARARVRSETRRTGARRLTPTARAARRHAPCTLPALWVRLGAAARTFCAAREEADGTGARAPTAACVARAASAAIGRASARRASVEAAAGARTALCSALCLLCARTPRKRRLAHVTPTRRIVDSYSLSTICFMQHGLGANQRPSTCHRRLHFVRFSPLFASFPAFHLLFARPPSACPSHPAALLFNAGTRRAAASPRSADR